MIAFIIWALVGCIFIGFGIASYFSKRPTGFWANSKMFEVTDVKKYNHAMCKLWSVSGIVFIIIGLPLLSEQNSPVIMFSVMGCFIWVITLMVIYELIICKKYKKN